MKTAMPAPYNELRCAFDPEKLHAYESFLKENAKDKVVCDLGAGCGVLSFLALYHGASKVICMDSNSASLKRAEEILGPGNEFIVCDLLTVDFPEADLYIHEIFGSALYEERIIPIFDNLRRQGLENKCFPNYAEFFSYDIDKLTSEVYEFDIKQYPEAAQEYFGKLTFEEMKFTDRVKTFRGYNYTEKKILEKVDLTVAKGSRYIYNMLELVPRLGWRSYFPNGASFSNTPRQGNNWYLLDNDFTPWRSRLLLTHTTESIKNPYKDL